MNHDKQKLDANLDRLLGLFNAPSSEQLQSSREQVQRMMPAEGFAVRPAPRRPYTERTWRLLGTAAAVAATIVASILLWPGGSAAIVEAADNGLYRVVGSRMESLRIGESVGIGEIVRSDGAASAMLALEDGSHIEMRSKSELALEDANDGLRIRLNDGSVIVSAAKDASRDLYVQTRDAKVSVGDTVSLVTTEAAGSHVVVLQGEARVEQGGTSKWLRPGEQTMTTPIRELRSVAQEIAWSRRSESLLPMIQQLAAALVSPQIPQSAGVPKWEAVAIRPCDDSLPQVAGARGNNGVGENFTVTPGRLSVYCMRVAVLMNLSYVRNGEALLNSSGLEQKDLIKGPEWIYSSKLSDRYSIEAKAEGTPDQKTMVGPMLQALLEDRFQLKSHREVEDISMLALVVAKGGPKIKAINESDCLPETQRGQPEGPKWLEQVRRGEKGFCYFVYGDEVRPGVLGTAYGGHTMTDFAGLVSRQVGKHIVDQTGLSGRFRFYLEHVPTPNSRLPMTPVDPGQPAPAPDILTAIQEQLGLRVVDGPKGPHQFIVVDRVERPSEN
jgi:uncharacterized protein (TIGR03435 family)